MMRVLRLSKWGELTVPDAWMFRKDALVRQTETVRVVGWVERIPSDPAGRATGPSKGCTGYLTVMPCDPDHPQAIALGAHRQVNVNPVLNMLGIPRAFLEQHEGSDLLELTFYQDGDAARYRADLTLILTATASLRKAFLDAPAGPLFEQGEPDD